MTVSAYVIGGKVVRYVSEKRVRSEWDRLLAADVEVLQEDTKKRYKREINASIDALKRADKEPPVEFYHLLNDIALNGAKGQDVLKGTLVLDLVSKQRVGDIANGRRLSRSLEAVELYRAIFINYETKAEKVDDFCARCGISKAKYYRIAKMALKSPSDVSFLKNIKKDIE